MLPSRKKLPHDVPEWVPSGSIYFVTINCLERGGNVLGNERIAGQLIKSIAVYEDLKKWHVRTMVVMPDHVHIIAVFSQQGICDTVRTWKSFHARVGGINWQSGFFEHRLRNEDECLEKIHYVLANPVRKGFVENWKKWPYVFTRGIW